MPKYLPAGLMQYVFNIFFQEVAAVPRHSGRRFESLPTAGGGADHRSSVGTGARWRNRGAVQDALGGTLRTFLGAGNGPPPLPPPHLALLGRNPGPAPPNQPPLPPNADRGGTQRELSRNNGERLLAPGYACVSRADWIRRYHDTVLPKEPNFGTREMIGYGGLEKTVRALPRTRYT